MDQWVDPSQAGPRIETPLHHADLPSRAAYSTDSADVTLAEYLPTGLLTLRFAPSLPSANSALQRVVALELPARLWCSETDDYCLRWMSPDEWLLSCPLREAFDIETRLRKELTGHLSIVNVSAGYTLLKLSGVAANAVLKKSTGYDVHPSNLPPGKVVNTTFAKTQATLRCLAPSEYEIIVRRSYADYAWLWLQSTATEYGLQVEAVLPSTD